MYKIYLTQNLNYISLFGSPRSYTDCDCRKPAPPKLSREISDLNLCVWIIIHSIMSTLHAESFVFQFVIQKFKD